MSLRFSSRVPKRGSRFGVISRSAFRVPPFAPPDRVDASVDWMIARVKWVDFSPRNRLRTHRAHSIGDLPEKLRIGAGNQVAVYGERVALEPISVNPTLNKNWENQCPFRYRA